MAIRGVAWSGAAPIARVDVSIDGGPWLETRLVGERKRNSWQWWEFFMRGDERPRGDSHAGHRHGGPDAACRAGVEPARLRE